MMQGVRRKSDLSLICLDSKNRVYIKEEKLFLDYFDHHQEISIQEIKELKLSMVSRIYNHSDLLVQKGVNPITLMQGYTKMPSMKYYFDIDIIMANQDILLESNDMIDSIPFILALLEVVNKVDDPLNILQWITNYSNNAESRVMLDTYLTKEFPPLAKKFHLENPRMENELMKDSLSKMHYN